MLLTIHDENGLIYEGAAPEEENKHTFFQEKGISEREIEYIYRRVSDRVKLKDYFKTTPTDEIIIKLKPVTNGL